MAYVERDDRDLELNEQSDLYEDEYYDEMYGSDGFGERIENGGDLDETMEFDDSEYAAGSAAEPKDSRNVENDFGEAINSSSNPHIEDQFEDEQLKSEAEAEYPQSED